MRDYITTIFNLIVGLVDADKIVLLALVGLGLIVVWQLISLLTNFHRRFANKCRKISKFLTKNGLSASNYNNFLALVAKMPQEFIRGYKTFEHASYGLPSDYIRRFDSIDVEINGGVLNHGKSIVKATIYGWTIILFVLSLALLGSTDPLTGFALADALVVPVLFLVLAKIVYFIFNAIKQQQYRMAVDEFNEMLDIMNDKIENNDNLPGPDLLAEVDLGISPNNTSSETDDNPTWIDLNDKNKNTSNAVHFADEISDTDFVEENTNTQVSRLSMNEIETYKQENSIVEPENTLAEENLDENVDGSWDASDLQQTTMVDNNEKQNQSETIFEDQLIAELSESPESLDNTKTEQTEYKENLQDGSGNDSAYVNEMPQKSSEAEVEFAKQTEETVPEQQNVKVAASKKSKKTPAEKTTKQTENKEEIMEEKRGRGRPKKIEEGELVITNDKQFEEVLARAEKLMRKSEEALSASQAKRVEKSLKELVDAMTKYKEEH